jgi:hypothetical protein
VSTGSDQIRYAMTYAESHYGLSRGRWVRTPFGGWYWSQR